MHLKYIFVTGGVVSSLGKGITTSSLGALLRARGYNVTAVKIDPYVNVDAGTMRPYEHGEVYVTGDGAETDLDLGTYERFLDVDLSRKNSITTGKVYLSVIDKERQGEYLAETVQVIPHITDEIKSRIAAAGSEAGAEIVLVEVGGTVGDIESLPFVEAIRQLRFEVGLANSFFLHVTLVPYLSAAEEHKTKPTQHSVATLRGMGIQPDALVLRSETPVPADSLRKIALFANVSGDAVFNAYDADFVYAVPEMLEEQGLARLVEERLGLTATAPDLSAWHEAVDVLRHPRGAVRIAVVGKYVAMPDAYLSLMEALKHAGIANRVSVHIDWVNSEELGADAVDELRSYDGILVPGGFGIRGIEGKIRAAHAARVTGVPYLGICLGMQVAVIEFARDVAGMPGANSTEFDPDTPYPVVDIVPVDGEVSGLGGAMRLGNWPMELSPGSIMEGVYLEQGLPSPVVERHRHRYEVNPTLEADLVAAGLVVTGRSPGKDGQGAGLVEAVELPSHPFFVGLQAQPEFSSRLTRPSPPMVGFIRAAHARAAQQGATTVVSEPAGAAGREGGGGTV